MNGGRAAPAMIAPVDPAAYLGLTPTRNPLRWHLPVVESLTTPQGTLVPRTQPGALLHDPQEVAERMVAMVRTGRLTASDGSDVAVSASSICVHGDSPAAVEMAIAVRKALTEAGIDVQPFVT